MARRTTLRRKIFLRIAPITILLMLISSQLAFNNIVSNFSREIGARVEAASEAFAKAAESRVQEAANATIAIAKNDLVINGIVDSDHREFTLKQFFRSLILPGPGNQTIYMTDYRGTPILHNSQTNLSTTSNEFKQDLQLLQPLWKSTVLEDGKTFVGTQSKNLVIASPILYSNQPEGAVVVIYPLTKFFTDILDHTSTTVTGIQYKDQVIASARHEVLKPGGLLSVPNGWIGSSTQVPGLPHTTAIVLESEQTVAAASNALLLALGFYLLTCTVVILLTIIATSYMVTNPLANLATRIMQVRETGDMSLRVEEDGPLELSILSTRFNKMLAELDRTTVSKEAYKKLALVAKYTDNAVVITDAEGRIEWVNDGFNRITGYELTEVVGQTPGSLLQGQSTDEETKKIMRDSIKEKRGFDVEIINYSKSGKPYWVAIETRPITDENGVVEKFIAIETDISRRKKAEKEKNELSLELQESARSAGMAEIATGVLHNVGNALNSINVSASLVLRSTGRSHLALLVKARDLIESNRHQLAEFLSNDPKGKMFPDFFKELVDAIQQENETRLIELESLAENVNHVKEIVAFQQNYAKRGGIIEPVCLKDLIDSVLKLNSDGLKTHQITIKRDYQINANVNINKHKLLQIIVNLITNAKQALRDSDTSDKEMTISIGEANGSFEIAVKDNGIGISAENLKNIFAHGFTTKSDGHGFGLHSSALVAQELNGSLSVSSDGEGLGATFLIKIPKHPDVYGQSHPNSEATYTPPTDSQIEPV